ncbi:DUF4115 domain-containing protein [Synechococcus sp. ATX 2A4]|uniref:DUF4115 domain-containing protein n=1 Tax=Synechococcus sp. ATX 2A4 TaxID=2823727 RepID=UPI0020CC8AA1|nr:DUF4115 domain-containing protein [Synechococcus sp. ATX 2A4]
MEVDLQVARLELQSNKIKLQSVLLRLSRTQQELEVAHRHKAELESLVSELPEIFERKFKDRCEPILERQRLLSEENQSLRQTLQHALPGFNPAQRTLMPAATPRAAPAPPTPLSQPSKERPAQLRTPLRPLRWLKGSLAAAPRLPQSRHKLVLIGGLVGLLSLGGSLGWHQHQRSSAATPPAKTTASEAEPPGQANSSSNVAVATTPKPNAIGPNEVALRSNQDNWVEVRNSAGTYLYVGLLKGEKRFALAEGLQVFAGRPDLLTIRRADGPPRLLGRISDVAWVTIQPPN